jgi:hypothetical protein
MLFTLGRYLALRLMRVVVLNACLDLRDGLLDMLQSIHPVATLVVRG